jgi:hypothetical protein
LTALVLYILLSLQSLLRIRPYQKKNEQTIKVRITKKIARKVLNRKPNCANLQAIVREAVRKLVLCHSGQTKLELRKSHVAHHLAANINLIAVEQTIEEVIFIIPSVYQGPSGVFQVLGTMFYFDNLF